MFKHTCWCGKLWEEKFTALTALCVCLSDLFLVCRIKDLSTAQWQHVSDPCVLSTTSMEGMINADAISTSKYS